jgi:hypothetical protein
MDRNWNRGGNSGAGGEKIYRQPYHQNHQNHHQQYRKKNDYSGQEFYSNTNSKITKPISSQPLKKEGLQVALVENELMDSNFSWVKNVGICISP